MFGAGGGGAYKHLTTGNASWRALGWELGQRGAELCHEVVHPASSATSYGALGKCLGLPRPHFVHLLNGPYNASS